jgi:hypothetical protein
MTEAEAHDFMTVWDEDGALNDPMLDRPLKGRDDHAETAPLRAARRGKALAPMMRFPVSADGAPGRQS